MLREVARVAFGDPRRLFRADGTLKNPSELDDDAAAMLAAIDVVETQRAGPPRNGESATQPEYVKRARMWDKLGALTLAMRHFGMLNDRQPADDDDVPAPVQIVVKVVDGRLDPPTT